MGRIRTIKPEFPQSESMGRVSREARLCFILLWTLVDDSGKTRASSRMLASLLYPYDEDAASMIEGWLEELARESCIDLYKINGNCYLQICKWNSHQKIDHPTKSKLPEFSEDSRVIAKPREALGKISVVSRTLTKDQGRDQGRDQGPKPLARSQKQKPRTPEPGIFDFPVVGEDDWYSLSQALYDEFVKTYTGVTVMNELEKARMWLVTNPTRQKTARGMPKFLNAWMAKQQNDGGGHGQQGQSSAGHTGRNRPAGGAAGGDKFLQNKENLAAARRRLRNDHGGAGGDGLFARDSGPARLADGDGEEAGPGKPGRSP